MRSNCIVAFIFCCSFILVIGCGSESSSDDDQPICGPPEVLDDAQSVAAGGHFACALRESGEIRCWGQDHDNGALCPPGGSYEQIALGGAHGCALSSGGEITCWGRGSSEDESAGRDASGHSNVGQAMPPGGKFSSIFAGKEISCAVADDGHTECWGDSSKAEYVPDTAKSIGFGVSHTCASLPDGSVHCDSGPGSEGEPMTQPPDGTYKDIVAGLRHTCGIQTDGSIGCWGESGYGGAVDDAPGGTFSEISSGNSHVCAVDDGGSLQCWGLGSDPENDQEHANADFDQAIPPDGAFKSVGCDWHRCCAVRDNGSIACWGAGSTGAYAPPAAN